MTTHEVNFDGLVGPTHNYAGLAAGNLASQSHKHQTSNPRAAALQGLAKMKLLADLGIPQAVLPPHERPHIPTLRALGFTGSDQQILLNAHRHNATLFANVSSASAMWAANAATISPSPDTQDARLHIIPANLTSHLHRAIETQTTTNILRAIFADPNLFAVHDPLPPSKHTMDEGAANHARLCATHDQPAVELFVHGSPSQSFPPRQSLLASQSIARLHTLSRDRTVFAAQNPTAIDAGAFHNDVVAVANQNVLLYHQLAFADPLATITSLTAALHHHCQTDLIPLCITDDQLTLAEAVSTYLFNSQLVTNPDAPATMSLIAPIECEKNTRARSLIESLIASPNNPITNALYVDTRQSMNNGGGPACLRLRIVLTQPQRDAIAPNIFLTPSLYDTLVQWVTKHYRDFLTPDDLPDPKLLDESLTALDQLTQILNLPSIYPFQSA